MSNQSGQQHHVQHPHLGNMFPNGTNAHMNPGMHGALGFPGAYNTQMGFHAPQPPQQAYANMAMMGMGAQNVQAQQARLHLQQLQARQVQARAHAQAQAQAQAQAVQAQQAQVQQAQVQQAQAQAQAQLQAQAQAQVQQRAQNQAMINNGAGPSNNPAQAGTSTETMPEQMAASHAKLAGLLALTEQSGPAQSLAVTAAVAPHLPQILALAKSGQLNSQQLNQLKTLVAMVAKHNGKPMPNQLQRPVQNSPQVPGAGGSFPNSPAMMNATPSQPIQQSHLQTANSQSPHLGQNLAPNQSHLGRVQQHAQNQQNPPQPTNHLPTPQQLHFQSQQLAAQNHAHLSQHPQSQQSHLQNQPHLQAQAQAQGSPPAQVIGIKRKAPPGTLSLPPNDLAQQANNANAGPVNGVQAGQANGTQMNGGTQANGFNQPANGVQVNGNHPQQANGAVPQQSGQPAQPTTRQMQAIILGRAKEIARQQGRMDEQSILQIARGLMAKFQQQQMERIKAQQQAQQAAQAQAQAQAQTQGQVAGMPGANLAQTSAQAQPQPPQSQPQPQQQPQPQAPAQVPQQLQQPQILPQQPQPTPASSSSQPQTQPQAPVQVPQQPQPQVQQPQAGPSISQPQASGPSLSGNADDSATAPTRPNSDLSMAQINNTSPTEETSPTLQPNTVNAPDAATPSSPHTMNVTNPGPQTWPVPKNLKTFGSFRLGARPTLSQGLPGGPVLGTPSQLLRFGAGDEALGLGIGEAETAEEKEDAGASVVAKKAGSMSEPGVGQPGKRTVQDLVAELDPRVTVDHEMESYLLARADEFIDSVMHFACRIAKHRGSDQVEPRDIQLHLERNHNIRIPGFASDEIRGALSRPSVEVKPKHMGGTDKSKKKKLNPEAAASVRAARVAAVQNARGMGRD